jgi:hypothetical protein
VTFWSTGSDLNNRDGQRNQKPKTLYAIAYKRSDKNTCISGAVFYPSNFFLITVSIILVVPFSRFWILFFKL